jgi:hypothetical protein
MALALILGLWASPNAGLWAACLLAPPAILWILGGSKAYPVLGWVAGMNWLAIAADVLRADVSGRSLGEGWLGPYHEQAILMSLCAVLAIAVGMRLGTRVGEWRLGARLRAMSPQTGVAGQIGLHRLLVCYAGAVLLSQALGALAAAMPTLTQPLIAFALVRDVVVYAIAASVFESNRGYSWLILVVGGEFLIGMTAYFADFTQPVFLLVLAMISTRYGLARVQSWILGLAAVAVLLWVSMVWSVIKIEYRSVMTGVPLQERVTWLADRYLSPDIDYADAATRLLDRIGYSELYADVLSHLDARAIPRNFDFYGAAIQHVLTPRVFFPGKPALNDSAITTALTGRSIGRDTSVGVGYIAQAHVDFGFPGLLLPILAIGLMLGLATEYFMTRPAPLLIRQAFATATVFSAFAFAADIDKALGGLITGWLAMALVMRFIYPMIATPVRDRQGVIAAHGARM